jgi:GDP-mannose 6-dehydrogenase
MSRPMNISVFGLGYVGVVTAGCLAREGHHVTGVDVNADKVAMLNAGQSPIIEEGIDDLLRTGCASGRITATTDVGPAAAETEMAIVCVGTPSEPNGSLNTRFLQAAAAQIGGAIGERSTPLLVVFRSTMLPGTIRSVLLPVLTEKSASAPGQKFEAVVHPEFLREGSSVKDFYDPPKIIIGERVPGAGRKLLELYANFKAPVFCTNYESAEMVKYSDNIFHALKITFANEIAQFCRTHGVDSHEVMDIFCHDTKLNLSGKYLRPGFAFGGSCLPKDLRAFLHAARQRDADLPMLASILPSNKAQIERALDAILQTGARRVGFFGLAFKPGTDDLRESPLVTLAELLSGKGIELKIYDDFVQVTRLLGKNKAYVEQHLPHLARLMVSRIKDLNDCELVVAGHAVKSAQIKEWLGLGLKIYDAASTRDRPFNPRGGLPPDKIPLHSVR